MAAYMDVDIVTNPLLMFSPSAKILGHPLVETISKILNGWKKG